MAMPRWAIAPGGSGREELLRSFWRGIVPACETGPRQIVEGTAARSFWRGIVPACETGPRQIVEGTAARVVLARDRAGVRDRFAPDRGGITPDVMSGPWGRVV